MILRPTSRLLGVSTLAMAVCWLTPAFAIAQEQPSWAGPNAQSAGQTGALLQAPADTAPRWSTLPDEAPTATQPLPQVPTLSFPAAQAVPEQRGPAAPAATPAAPPAARASTAAALSPASGEAEIAVSGNPNQAGPSADLLLIDRQLSDAIYDSGPLAGYGAAISSDGMLYDSNGPSAQGSEGVVSRFRSFPSDLKLERRPQRALADGITGSSWGVFAVKRGEQTLTEGFYVTSWRREAGGWRIVAELAAGRAPTQAPIPAMPRTQGATPPAPGAGTPRAPSPAAPAASPSGAPRQLRDALGRPIRPAAPASPQSASPASAAPASESRPSPGGS